MVALTNETLTIGSGENVQGESPRGLSAPRGLTMESFQGELGGTSIVGKGRDPRLTDAVAELRESMGRIAAGTQRARLIEEIYSKGGEELLLEICQETVLAKPRFVGDLSQITSAVTDSGLSQAQKESLLAFIAERLTLNVLQDLYHREDGVNFLQRQGANAEGWRALQDIWVAFHCYQGGPPGVEAVPGAIGRGLVAFEAWANEQRESPSRQRTLSNLSEAFERKVFQVYQVDQQHIPNPAATAERGTSPSSLGNPENGSSLPPPRTPPPALEPRHSAPPPEAVLTRTPGDTPSKELLISIARECAIAELNASEDELTLLRLSDRNNPAFLDLSEQVERRTKEILDETRRQVFSLARDELGSDEKIYQLLDRELLARETYERRVNGGVPSAEPHTPTLDEIARRTQSRLNDRLVLERDAPLTRRELIHPNEESLVEREMHAKLREEAFRTLEAGLPQHEKERLRRDPAYRAEMTSLAEDLVKEQIAKQWVALSAEEKIALTQGLGKANYSWADDGSTLATPEVLQVFTERVSKELKVLGVARAETARTLDFDSQCYDILSSELSGTNEISGKDLAQAIMKSIEDPDGTGSSTEFTTFMRWVKDNYGRLSPEAIEIVHAYESLARRNRRVGHTAIDLEELLRSFDEALGLAA